MPTSEGGLLGAALVGEKLSVNGRNVAVTKLLGEGGFSYVYLVKEMSDSGGLNNTVHGSDGNGKRRSNKEEPISRSSEGAGGKKEDLVLKVTSIVSRQQRDIAEKEAKLLSRLSHPSIIKMFDTCYRTPANEKSGGFRGGDGGKKERPQHLILMEYCEGGHALSVCNSLMASGMRFDIGTLIIAFGQICNAVSYLHAQRPPIVHRDLKPANFLVQDGAYKLCDFGSAVIGHIKLDTPQARGEAEEVVQKTTTQMFRAPEMVDLFMAKKLTQATDVWALGCCLYSMAFLQDCFEEGSNLAIISRNYKIPDDNPYGEGLVELIDRMLTVDVKARADMTDVILCLSALYSGRELPPRKEPKPSKRDKEGKKDKDDGKSPHKQKVKKGERVGTYRTDGQGVQSDNKKSKEGKALDPNSAAARRRRAAAGNTGTDAGFENFGTESEGNAFSSDFNAFGETSGAFSSGGEWATGDTAMDEAFASFDLDSGEGRRKPPGRQRSSSTRRQRRKDDKDDKADDKAEDDEDGEEEIDESGVTRSVRHARQSRGVRRQNSIGRGLRSKSKSRTRKVGNSKSRKDNSDSEEESQ